MAWYELTSVVDIYRRNGPKVHLLRLSSQSPNSHWWIFDKPTMSADKIDQAQLIPIYFMDRSKIIRIIIESFFYQGQTGFMSSIDIFDVDVWILFKHETFSSYQSSEKEYSH